MYYKGDLVVECLSVYLFQRSQYFYSMEGHVDRTSLLNRVCGELTCSQKVLGIDIFQNKNIYIIKVVSQIKKRQYFNNSWSYFSASMH